MFSHWKLLQLNCSSIHCAACFPSADMENKSPLLTSHAHESHGECINREFPSPFYFPHSKNFLTTSFPIKFLSHPPFQPPSFSQSKEQGPTITILMLLLHWEDGDGEFFSCYFFISDFFSQHAADIFCNNQWQGDCYHLSFMVVWKPWTTCNSVWNCMQDWGHLLA